MIKSTNKGRTRKGSGRAVISSIAASRAVLLIKTIVAIALMTPAGLLDVGRGAESQTASSPKRGGTLRLCFPTDWRSLDPAIAFDADAAPLQKLLFRGLLNFDDGIGLVPDQAEDWNISEDGKTYTFRLRKGVKFSTGREVDSQDFVFSFERTLDPKTGSVGQSYLLDIEGALEFNQGKATGVWGLRAPDPRTFVIRLKEPRFTFRFVLALNFTDVLPRDVVKQFGNDFQYHLAGSGPYRVAEWVRNVRWRFERNPHYKGNEGFVDAVDIMFGGDPSLGAMLLERGEIDRVVATPPDAVRFSRDAKLRPRLHRVDTANTDYFFMNTEVKPFDDVRVRRAVSHAITKERLIKLTGGFGVVAHEIVPPSMPWKNPGLPRYEYDVRKAKTLLTEAGYPQGFKTELWYIVTRPTDARISEGIQQDLREIGIHADLKPVFYSAFEVKVRSRGQAACGVWGWMQDYPDPSNFLDVLLNGELIRDKESNNQAFYNNPAVNALLRRAGESTDADTRTALFRQAESKIMADAPWVPILHEQLPILMHPRLRGTEPHPVWLWRYERMWLEPGL